MHKQRLLIGIASVIGLVGCFFPWVSVGVKMPFINSSGISSNAIALPYGFLILLGFLVTGFFAFFHGNRNEKIDPNKTKLILGAAGTVIFLAFYCILQMTSTGFSAFKMVNLKFGIGIYISIASGIGIGCFAHFMKTPANGTDQPTDQTGPGQAD